LARLEALCLAAALAAKTWPPDFVEGGLKGFV
jgi:hypothetical protein